MAEAPAKRHRKSFAADMLHLSPTRGTTARRQEVGNAVFSSRAVLDGFRGSIGVRSKRFDTNSSTSGRLKSDTTKRRRYAREPMDHCCCSHRVAMAIISGEKKTDTRAHAHTKTEVKYDENKKKGDSISVAGPGKK